MKAIELSKENLDDQVSVILTAEEFDALMGLAYERHNELVNKTPQEPTEEDSQSLLDYAAMLASAGDKIHAVLIAEYGVLLSPAEEKACMDAVNKKPTWLQ